MKSEITVIQKLKEFDIEPRGVLHIGAGNVEEAEEYRDFGFKKVFWVDILDCNPERRRLADKLGHTFIHAAVDDHSFAQVTFHVASNGSSSSFLPFGTHQQLYPNITETDVINVETVTGKELIESYPEITECNVLNVDVQGAELRVLDGMVDHLAQFDLVFCEIYLDEVYQGCGKLIDVNDLLWYSGFVCMDVWIKPKEGWGNAVWVKRSLL